MDVIRGMRINNPRPDSDLCYSGIDPWQLVGFISALPQPRSPCLPRTPNGAGDIWSLSKADPCGEGCSVGELNAKGELLCRAWPHSSSWHLKQRGVIRTTQPVQCPVPVQGAPLRLGENVAQQVRIHEQGDLGFIEQKSLAPDKACGVSPQGSR